MLQEERERGIMSTTTTYRIDIDGTIAEPRFFDEHFQTCIDWYRSAGIVKQEEVASLTFHQQLFLLPHVLVTHKPVAGSVEMLSCLVEQGHTLQYFTVRQAIDPPVCRMVHEDTRAWLEAMHFPCASAVSFFWDAGEKLLRSLDAPEERIMLIDDRPSGLARAYEVILEKDPEKARQIRERIVLVAFGITDSRMLPALAGLRIVPLLSWADLKRVCSE
jgi:hypothetical protein